MASSRIGARDDEKIAAVSALHGDLDLGHHVLERHHPAAQHVAAFLGEFLIFKLDRRRARRLVAAHRVLDVEEPAITSVAIGDQRRRAYGFDLGDAPDHIGVGGDAGVGQAEI